MKVLEPDTRAATTITQTNMARIQTYNTTSLVLGTDKLVGTDVDDDFATKNFTVDELGSFIIENNNDLVALTKLNFRIEHSLFKAGWFYDSLRTGLENVKTPKLWITAENLPDGDDYGILIERHKRQGKRGPLQPPRRGGWKRMNLLSMQGDYANRVLEIPITDKTGQFYDFKLDHYFKAMSFPGPSGGRSSTSNTRSSKQYFALRLTKGPEGNKKISPIINTIKVIGAKENNGMGSVFKYITIAPESL